MKASNSADPRCRIYAALDIGLGVAYAALISAVLPSGHQGPTVLLWAIVGCILAAGGGMLARTPWGWRTAAIACSALLALEVVLLALLVTGASFLAGVYGGFGRGAASMVLLAAVLSIQAIALVPALQLKYLMTRAGRKAYGRS